jgi:hypothetical protein
MDRPGSYLGRGLDVIPGKPFGWSWNRERQEIRTHLIRKGWKPDDPALHFRIVHIQERLHRYRPSFRERQQAWLATMPKPNAANVSFTWEELERLVELHGQANDPVTQEIARKASSALLGRPAND